MSRTAAADDVDLARDRTLVELAQSGDMDAFGALYSRYFRRLVRFSAKRVGDVHEAEEIAQEAFARAYRALPNFAGERRFYPWMTVIASRLCVDTLRRRGRVEVGEITEYEFHDVGFERIDVEGDLATLAQAMTRLTDRHREVLELRERHGWSYQHIADHYQVSIGTVEALLWRARKALRREFAALGSALLVIPGFRRLIARVNSPHPAAVAAIGSVGTIVALTFAGGSPSSYPVTQVASAPTGSVIRVVNSATSPLTVAAPGAVTSTSAGSSGHANGLEVAPVAAPAPAPRKNLAMVGSSTEVARAAESQPIVIRIGEEGPVIGLRSPVNGVKASLTVPVVPALP